VTITGSPAPAGPEAVEPDLPPAAAKAAAPEITSAAKPLVELRGLSKAFATKIPWPKTAAPPHIKL